MTETTNKSAEELTLRNRIIGILLRDARERAERSKRECAAALGVSSSTITAYEEGRKAISLPELEVLAYLTDLPVEHFWEDTPSLVPKSKQLPLEEVLTLRHRIIGALLRQARLEKELSQKDIADLLGCSPSQVSAYEYGERPIPLPELELAANHLNLSLDYFIDEREGPVGEWHQRQENIKRFQNLPESVQKFVTQPLNIKYLEIAMRLAEIPAGGLRAIAEGLLEITY